MMHSEKEFIFGMHPVMEAIKGGRQIDRLLVRQGLRGELYHELMKMVAELGVPHPEDHAGELLARRGQGCAKCRYTGYYGRTGLFEILPVNGRLRHLIAEGATPEVLARTARQDGLKSLREHAVRKAASVKLDRLNQAGHRTTGSHRRRHPTFT